MIDGAERKEVSPDRDLSRPLSLYSIRTFRETIDNPTSLDCQPVLGEPRTNTLLQA